MTTREKVEEWIKKAPKEIHIEMPISMNKTQENITELGRATPKIVDRGYEGIIRFISRGWEKEE